MKRASIYTLIGCIMSAYLILDGVAVFMGSEVFSGISKVLPILKAVPEPQHINALFGFTLLSTALFTGISSFERDRRRQRQFSYMHMLNAFAWVAYVWWRITEWSGLGRVLYPTVATSILALSGIMYSTTFRHGPSKGVVRPVALFSTCSMIISIVQAIAGIALVVGSEAFFKLSTKVPGSKLIHSAIPHTTALLGLSLISWGALSWVAAWERDRHRQRQFAYAHLFLSLAWTVYMWARATDWNVVGMILYPGMATALFGMSIGLYFASKPRPPIKDQNAREHKETLAPAIKTADDYVTGQGRAKPGHNDIARLPPTVSYVDPKKHVDDDTTSGPQFRIGLEGARRREQRV